jgi:hypothetical protein
MMHSRHVANRCSHECTRQRQSGKPLHKQERNAEVAFVVESRSTLRVLGEMPDASNGPAASPHGLSKKKVADALLLHLLSLPVSQDDHRRGRHPGASAVKQLVGPQCRDDAEGQQGVSPDAIASSKC